MQNTIQTPNKKIKQELLDKKDKIAKWISSLTTSPFQIITFLIFTELNAPLITYPIVNTITNLISCIFFLVIPSIPLIILNKRSRIINGEISREDRYLIFLVLIPNYICLIFVYNIISMLFDVNYRSLISYTSSYICVLLVDFILTCIFKFKTSMHVSGAACAITSLSFILGPLFLLLYLFIMVIAWARWRIKGHNIPQLISGWINGIFISLLILIFFTAI
ncbi:MAG: hypothetical protein ACTSRP_10955 [Candidatus Helarchaeota archaeon]